MAEIDRITVTMNAEMTALVKSAIDAGDYASANDVVHEALRDWKARRALRQGALQTLKTDIGIGLADVAEGRIKAFDATAVVNQGSRRLARHLRSA